MENTALRRHHRIRVSLPLMVLVFSLLPAAAKAQFIQQGPKLVGTGAVKNGYIDVSQGDSVSLSGDGNTAIVGGQGDNDAAGAAWVFTRSAGVWTQQAKLVGTGAALGGSAQQGASVALSGDGNTAIVGGPADGTGNNPYVGAAWVFIRSAGVWTQQMKLVGTGTFGTPFQGASVALSGDGNTAIVGGPGDNNGVGAAWVFTRSAGVWTQQMKLVGTGAALGGSPQQGASVALSGDGDTAIVGGPGDNNGVGAAWVFTRSAGVWTQQMKLVGTGVVGDFALQGASVSLSGDGNTAIVGGPGDNLMEDEVELVGAAWVFTRSAGAWTQQAKLVSAGLFFVLGQGGSVSLSSDGNTAVVGGPMVVGFSDDNNATAFVFTRSTGVWTQQMKLVDTAVVGQTGFGGIAVSAVSLSGDGNTAIIGGPLDNDGAGAAWVYGQPVTFFAGTPGKANCFGQTVTILQAEFGGLNSAAAALEFPTVPALQNAILAFCHG